MQLLTLHCFFLTLITVFLYFYYHIPLSVSNIFPFCIFYFHLVFFTLLAARPLSAVYCLIRFHCNLPVKHFIVHDEKKMWNQNMKKIRKLSRKYNSKQKWNKHHCRCECKKPMKHRVYKEYYTWNPSICTCNYNKDCEILNNYTWIKGPSNNLVNMYDEIADML